MKTEPEVEAEAETLALAEKTLHLLEYSFVMEKAAARALSDEAAAVIRNEKPLYDPEKAAELKNSVFSILERMASSDNMPISWLPSIGFLLPKIRVEGTVLEIDEAYAIGLFIERAEELIKWLKEEKNGEHANEPGIIDSLFLDSIPVCAPIAAEIFKILDREGKMRDLPPLRAIKKRLKNLGRELEASVSRYTSNEDTRRMLQSALPSQRDGRMVLAVKANFRGRIRGIVHEVSSSGQTIFVEPLEVVEKNNEILVEKRNLEAEILKILRDLTAKIASYASIAGDAGVAGDTGLEKYHLTIIKLECLRAKARYSMDIKGHFANDSPDGSLIIKQARHPMLKNAVPINLSMNSGTRTLIITGPNTGGKTVALKTLGLFALINQSGLALPAAEGSCLPVFDGVYADIGDKQSIEQSLSTFSAHISNIAAIVSKATEKSLILLDELGSGTDPQEGGAIAMAILDYLIEKKSRMIITTHHGILKNYGYTRAGVENASVEFDAKTLSPTYKIINGVPGESHALDIALRNGLAKNIVEMARNYLVEEKSDVSLLIKGLKEKHLELDGLENKAKIEGNRLRDERRKTDLKELRLRQKEAELKRQTAGKLGALLQESRKTLENLVREIKEGKLDHEKTRKVKDFLSNLAQTAENENAALEDEEYKIKEELQNIESAALDASVFASCAAGEIAVGMEVIIGPAKQRGTVLRLDKKSAAGNFWIVETGSLKISFPEKDLRLMARRFPRGKNTNTPNAAAKAGWVAEFDTSSAGAVFELKLLGMRLDEALEALRRQLEAAALSGLNTFAVVHGKGNGILQKGVHEYLKNDPAIADYYFSSPEHGGAGRTVVVLKS